MKKKVVIAILIVVLAGGGITGGVVGYRAYQNSKLVAEVQSVSMLNTGSWGDSMESDGTVTNGQQQDVYVSTEQTIQKVFVTEGQEVSEGGSLAYCRSICFCVATLILSPSPSSRERRQ